MTHAATVDTKKLANILGVLPRLLRQPDKVLLVANFVNELQKVFGLHKVTVYAIHPTFRTIFRRGVPRDKQEFIHKIEFTDASDGEIHQLIAVCKES